MYIGFDMIHEREKIAVFTYRSPKMFPLETPWGNHAKCCMDGKRIRCWKENSMLTNCLAACAHLSITVSEIKRDICEKIVILSYPSCIRRPR